MLDHVVADHEVEAAGRKAPGLDVAEYRFLRVVVVAELVLVDVDHGDVSTAQYVERQETGRAAAGLVDRQPGGWQSGAENAVNGEQAFAGLAGRQVEQRLRMRRHQRCGETVGRDRMCEIDGGCLAHWLLSVDVGEFGSE